VVEAPLSGGRSAPSRISARLVIVWALLAVLAAAIVLIERHDRAASRAEEQARDERMLLPVSILELGAVEVVDKGTLHRFERDANSAWFYHGIHAEAQAQHEHTVDPVAAQRIDKALLGFGRTRMEREYPLDVKADEFGVTRPDMFIMVYMPKSVQPLARYAVGTVAPDKVSRYVLPVGQAHVVTIPDFHIDNLLRLIASFQTAPANPASASGGR
jgi:hypothetical protein